MRIRRLVLQGFGSVTANLAFASDRLNLVVGPNESGKTTLAAALAAALYGLNDDGRRHRALTPRKQYEPWDGGAFALELTFETGSGRYTVNRNLARGTVTVFEEGRGNVTEDFRHGSGEYMIGEELLGLSLEQFARSALCLQEGPVGLAGDDVRPDVRVATLLERQASSVAGDLSAQSALNVLDLALQRYPVGERRMTIGNHVKMVETKLEQLRAQLRDETTRADRAALSLAELGSVRAEEAEWARAERRMVLHGLRAGLAELEHDIGREEEEQREITALSAELTSLAGIEPLPADAAERLRRAQTERASAETALAELEARRAAAVERPRQEVEDQLAERRALAWAAPVHLEEIAALERDLVRGRESLEQARQRREETEAELERAGVDVRRWEEMGRRFAALDPSESALLTRAPASIQAWGSEKEKADQVAQESGARLGQIARERGGIRAVAFVIGVLGLAAGAGSVWMAVSGRIELSFAGLAVTLAGIAFALVLGLRAAAHRAGDREIALRAVTEANRRQQALREQAAERTLALEEIARRLGVLSPEALLAEHAEFLRVEREGSRLRWGREDEARLRQESRELWGRATAWAIRAGGTPPEATWDAEAGLRAVRERLTQLLALRGQAERLSQQEREFLDQESVIRERRDLALARAREVARSLGTPDGEWEKALERVEARRQAMERRAFLESTLTRLRARIRTDAERADRFAEAQALGAEIERTAAETEPGPPLTSEEAKRTRAEWESERRAARKRHEAVNQRRLELERDVSFLENPKREDAASRMRIEIEELERERDRARRFQQAVMLAREKLTSVARETNSRWSEYLSRRVNELLPKLGPEYRGFLVTDDLDYSLELGGQRLEREKLDQALSAGARDQLRLALRLAVCEFLSRGDHKLPLVFDDPFAQADDARAEAGLRFLADRFANEHQMIVLTCHRARAEELKRQDPLWFAEHVHWIDFGPGADVRQMDIAEEAEPTR